MLNPCFMIDDLLLRKMRHSIFSLAVSLAWLDPSTQGAHQSEICMLWIECISPIDKHPAHM